MAPNAKGFARRCTIVLSMVAIEPQRLRYIAIKAAIIIKAGNARDRAKGKADHDSFRLQLLAARIFIKCQHEPCWSCARLHASPRRFWKRKRLVAADGPPALCTQSKKRDLAVHE